MNLKKGVLSVVLWCIYAIIVGTGMVGTALTVILPSGGSRPIGLVIAGVWLAVTGLVVFLLHKFLEKEQRRKAADRRQVKLIIESLVVVILIAVGIALRTGEILQYDIIGEGGNVWFDTVKVTETTQIPQVVHGAVYFYLQVLHGLLLFLGNKMTVALTLQAALQILTGVFMYFAVRKLTGVIAAVTAVGYWMLCPLSGNVVVLGPENLYQLLWMIGLCIIAETLGSFGQKSKEPGIRPVIGFFFSGIIVGTLIYLDIMGALLLCILFSVIVLETEKEIVFYRRFFAVMLGVAGALGAFFLCIAFDAVGSGKQMENVLLAWWKVYAPQTFALPITRMGDNAFGTVAVMAILGIGVFSYWCRKKIERQSEWMAAVIGLGTLICFGITGEEMQGLSLLCLLVAVLAGAGVQAVFPYVQLQDAVQPIPDVRETEETVTGNASLKKRLKVQDLETDELQGEKVTEDPERSDAPQFIENPLPVPKKHVPKVLDYKMSDNVGDFDYPVSDDDDFDY